MLDLLMDTPLTPEQKDYVGTMRRSTNVLLTVISDILDFRFVSLSYYNVHYS